MNGWIDLFMEKSIVRCVLGPGMSRTTVIHRILSVARSSGDGAVCFFLKEKTGQIIYLFILLAIASSII
jgi:hypothetical protein